MAGTDAADYAQRLERLQDASWKQLLDVQRPYRWNLRRLQPGFVLDVGCGLGRNLAHIDGYGVGIDHNAESVAKARARGLVAYTPEDFAVSEYARPHRFDSLLSAHVVEHMNLEDATDLLAAHLGYVRSGGKVILITPQESGFASDSTHVEYFDFDGLRRLCSNLGVSETSVRSFPFPRVAGKVFRYNEFVLVARKP